MEGHEPEEPQRSPREDARADPEGHPLAQMLAIGLIASLAGIALGLLIDWFPVQASSQAKEIDSLYDLLIIVSVPVFVLVLVIVLYSVWRFRMKPGEETKDGPPIHGNTRLEVVWTAIPALILVAICSYAYVVLRDIEEAQAGEMVVTVTAEQFAWTFEYPGSKGQRGKPVASTQLYLPEGQPVKFQVKSKDVIHSFWVPAFRMKVDAVPGITTQSRVTPTRRGSYPVVCAELCGLGHSVMRSTANVVSAAEFEKWLAERAKPPAKGAGGDDAGKALFTGAVGCGACHRLAAAGSTAAIGPNLDDVLAGQKPDAIRESIVDPGAKLSKGFGDGIMPPNFGETLSPDELDALVEYLSKATAK